MKKDDNDKKDNVDVEMVDYSEVHSDHPAVRPSSRQHNTRPSLGRLESEMTNTTVLLATMETEEEISEVTNHDESDNDDNNNSSDNIMNMLVTSSHPDKIQCQLCTQIYTEYDNVCISNNIHCQHQFHEYCMAKWLQNQNLCPICNKTYIHVHHNV